jgi:NADPH2:quinone reductase
VRAIVFDQAGEPAGVLRAAGIARPAASAGFALVRVTARPIHPADLSFIRGQYRLRPAFPQTAGLEGMGTIVEVVGGVDLEPGTRVAFRWPGSWAEYAAVPAHRLIAVPPDVGGESAAQMSLNPLTAWALLEEAQATRDDAIIVTAAASTVSRLVRDIATTRGIATIGVVRGDPARMSAEYPDGVVSSDDAQLGAAIASAAGARRIAGLLDCVGGPVVSDLMSTLSPGGRIVAYGVLDQRAAAVTNAALIYKNLTWSGFGIDRWLEGTASERLAVAYASLWSMIATGTLHLPVAARCPLDAFADALTASTATGSGKILLI